MFISHSPELLAFVGVVGVEIMVHTVPATLGRLRLISTPLGVWLCCEHNCSLALHVLGLGFLLLRVRSRELKEGEAPFLSSCALGRQVEQLQRCAQILVDGKLLLHLNIADAIGER